MNRRQWFSRVPAAGAAGPSVAAPRPMAAKTADPPAAKRAAAQDHRRQDDPHRAGRHPPGRRQGADQRAGAVRPGLRHLHPAGPRRRDGRRQVPQAVPDRQGPAADRGHLAVGVRQLVLAQRPGARQRPQRRRHGPVGHPRQAGRHAASTSCSAASAARRSIPIATPAAARFEEVEKAAAGVMERGLPPRPRPGRRARAWRPTAPAQRRGDGDRRARQPPHRSLGAAGRTCRIVPKLFEHLRKQLGDEVELLHDVHERVPPILAMQLAKDLEPYRLFFLEDPFSPEDVGYFENLRQQTSTPIAMGELFNNPNEYVPLITEPADRLHPHPHLADRRPDDGPQGGGAVRVLRRPHRLARPGRRLAGRPRRQRPPRPGHAQLRHPGRPRASRRPSRTSSPAARS